MTKRTSTSFIGSFSPESASDMQRLQEFRELTKMFNRESGSKMYIKVQGRGKNRVERALPYYEEKYGKEWCQRNMGYIRGRVAMSLPAAVAEYYDVYLYRRR